MRSMGVAGSAFSMALVFLVVAGAGQATDNRVISVLAKTTTARLQDKAPKGDSPGDVLAGSDVLRNAVAQFGKPKGAIVGRDHWQLVNKNAAAATIRVTASLPGGTISCRGTLRASDKVSAIRVVGGTGVFSRATGRCESRPAANRRSLNVYRLNIP